MEKYPREYLEFMDLFNRGCFFEAHEALEQLWRREKGPACDFYHGLIQIAALFVHLTKAENAKPQQSAPEGALRLLETSRKYLEPYGAFYAGLDVQQLLSSVRASVTEGLPAPRLILDV